MGNRWPYGGLDRLAPPDDENPARDSTEEWESGNTTGDANPVRLHLVTVEILGPQIVWDPATEEDDRVLDEDDTRLETGRIRSPSRRFSTTRSRVIPTPTAPVSGS